MGRPRALVLGTGGAARAAVVALAELLSSRGGHHPRGAAPTRSAKRCARSSPRAARRVAATLSVEPFAGSPDRDRDVEVVLQGTSAGMHGAEPGEPCAAAVAWDALPAHAVALEIIYAPPETPFILRAATAHGIRTANASACFARQGALAFELWLASLLRTTRCSRR